MISPVWRKPVKTFIMIMFTAVSLTGLAAYGPGQRGEEDAPEAPSALHMEHVQEAFKILFYDHSEEGKAFNGEQLDDLMHERYAQVSRSLISEGATHRVFSSYLHNKMDKLRADLQAVSSAGLKERSANDVRHPVFADLDRALASGLVVMDKDVRKAISLFSDTKEATATARDQYQSYRNGVEHDFNLAALDHLEQAYLAHLYLAVKSNTKRERQRHLFSVGLLGLKLWSFNKEDVGIIPLLIIADGNPDVDSGHLRKLSWLLLNDHVRFANSGSGGEKVPFYWLYTLKEVGKI